MSVEAILEKFELFGVKLGLEPSFQLLEALGNPHQQVPIIHVAGSNGKGSVCAYLSAVLTAAGYRVGRYTSPHLVNWCERICLNEQPIAPEVLEQVLHQVTAAINPDEPSPTQFEVITAAAWLYFAQQRVDIAVMEVGLGGRLDATNVCDRPLVSIITSISREHWQRLGPTLADIAGEKAGILKPECPAVIGHLPPEAAAVINRRIADLGCPATYPNPARDLGNGWVEYQGLDAVDSEVEASGAVLHSVVQTETAIRYRLPLQGAIQLQNSALAIAALLILQKQGWQLSNTTIAKGIEKTQWPGRLQWYGWHGHKILIDGAHNPASAEVLRQFVDNLMTPADRPAARFSSVNWVMGMLSTKDHADVFQALLRPGDRLYLVPVPGHSSADPEHLARLASEICPDLAHCQTYSDAERGLQAALESADRPSPESLTIFCGSLYLIGSFFAQEQH